jgi:protein subunit release factor B
MKGDNQPEIPEVDLEEVFERSSGPGGQNVNKTSTKVTLRHKPTGTSVTVQDTRSQAQNRVLARKRLAAALKEAARKRKQAEVDARERERRRKAPRPGKVKRHFIEVKRHKARIRQQRKSSDWE